MRLCTCVLAFVFVGVSNVVLMDFRPPGAMTVDTSNNIYVVQDVFTGVIRKISPTGIVTSSTLTTGSLGVAVSSSGVVYTSRYFARLLIAMPSFKSATQTFMAGIHDGKEVLIVVCMCMCVCVLWG
jgi:hypothetical protein